MRKKPIREAVMSATKGFTGAARPPAMRAARLTARRLLAQRRRRLLRRVGVGVGVLGATTAAAKMKGRTLFPEPPSVEAMERGYGPYYENQERVEMYPFVSEAQRRWMWLHHPEMAKRWEEHTPKGKKLPERKHPVKWVCPRCGHTTMALKQPTCSKCGVKMKEVLKVQHEIVEKAISYGIARRV